MESVAVYSMRRAYPESATLSVSIVSIPNSRSRCDAVSNGHSVLMPVDRVTLLHTPLDGVLANLMRYLSSFVQACTHLKVNVTGNHPNIFETS
jgi:hypothetical protein